MRPPPTYAELLTLARHAARRDLAPDILQKRADGLVKRWETYRIAEIAKERAPLRGQE